MNILTTFAVLLLAISFSTGTQQKETNQIFANIKKPETNNGFTVNDQDYTLYFDVEKVIGQKPTLVIVIELHNGSHYVSPFSKKDFKGKFYMDLGSYTDLDFDGDIIESNRSFEEFDYHTFGEENVNWVWMNTTYTQALKILAKDDFEVFGRLRFTIEPRCTMEEIPFAISYKNGEMKIISPKC